MKAVTKNIIAMPGVILFFIVLAYGWYFAILQPQRKVATLFLDALKNRDAKLLQKVVAPEEYALYKRLYLKNGYNKHLISYEGLEERDADNHFFPSRSRFSTEAVEDDTFFGRREYTYFISLQKRDDRWWVIQFSTLQDRKDLKTLKEFKPPKEEKATP